MGEHLSTNIAICGGRPAITITMSVCTTSRENRVCAVARLSNASSSLNAVHIFVQAARNSHRCEKSRRAAHSTSREVRERYINCGWNLIRLAALKGQRERDVSPRVTHRMLIERLVSALEMNDRCGCCAIDSRDMFGKPRVDGYRRGSSGGIVCRPRLTSICRNGRYRRNLELKFIANSDGCLWR